MTDSLKPVSRDYLDNLTFEEYLDRAKEAGLLVQEFGDYTYLLHPDSPYPIYQLIYKHDHKKFSPVWVNIIKEVSGSITLSTSGLRLTDPEDVSLYRTQFLFCSKYVEENSTLEKR